MTGKETLKVEKIFPAREGKNQDFSLLQVRSSASSQDGRASDITSFFLGGNFEKKGKVAFQTVANKVVQEKKIKVGTDLGKASGKDLRIRITEKLDDGSENLGFQAKINPSTGQVLTQGSRDILRKAEIRPADEADQLITADGVREAVKAEAEEVELAG